MPIFEEGTNFPAVLGRKNIPSTIIRAQKLIRSPIPLGQQAMALIRGETPIHLAQRLAPRSGSQLPPFNTPGLMSVLPQLFKQVNVRRKIRDTFPTLKRLSPQNIPSPYVRPGTWPPTRGVAELPSVAGGPISGPSRTVLPQISVIT